MYSSVFGVGSAATVFFLFWFFLPLLHNHHRYPRRPRGSQSGQGKRRDESFLADWLPLGLQGCITTPLKGRSQRWSFWSGRDLDQSQKNAIFSAEIQSTAKFFSSNSQEENLFFLWEISSKMLDNFPIKLSHLHLTSTRVRVWFERITVNNRMAIFSYC